MVALTCFSSSPSLAVPDDFLYRLITDDNVQGKALVKMMQFDSVTALVPVWRTDTYGNGLYQTVKDKFQSAGGTVLNGISYQPGATNFGDMITLLTPQVTAAIASFGASHVAVILITYQEAADLLKAASDVGDLSRVKWYGCDANVQKSAISGDPVAGPFARVTRFLAPIMGIGTAGNLPATADDLTRKIAARTGLIPDAYSLSAYDAIQIVAKAYDVVRSTDADGIRMVIPWICESYNYLGVSRKLNDAGDLLTANYIFWTVVPSAGGYSWDSFSTYMADGDYILPR
jgi:branched-chain amino acid transport system substrate-binding protein